MASKSPNFNEAVIRNHKLLILMLGEVLQQLRSEITKARPIIL